MEQINISAISAAVEKQQKSVWHKILPILFFLSFAVANIYNAIMTVNGISIYTASSVGDIVYYVLFYGIIDYILYRVLFWLYSLFLNRSVFAMCIPFIIFKDHFQLCYLTKNIIMGVVAILCLKAPYILTLLPVLSLVLNLAIIPVIFQINRKTFIPDLVAHNVFKAYAMPYFIYFFVDVIAFVMGVA